MISIQLVSTVEKFSELKDQWNQLLSASPADNYFLRWEWLWTWWEVFRPENSRLAIILVSRNNQLIGIAPFYVIHSHMACFRIRRLLFLGSTIGNTGYVGSEGLDIICDQSNREEIVRAVWRCVQDDLCEEMYLLHVDDESKTIASFLEKAVSAGYLSQESHRWLSPYTVLPRTWEAFLESLSSNMRSKIRKNERLLQQSGEYLFRKTQCHNDLESDYNELIRLHQLRWETRGMKGAFADENFCRFHKTVMKHMLDEKRLLLCVLERRGRPAGVVYSILYNKKVYYYQSGIDVSVDKQIAPGVLLHSWSIRQAISEGDQQYLFGLKGGLDSYKERWAHASKTLLDVYLVKPGIWRHFVKAKLWAASMVHALRNRAMWIKAQRTQGSGFGHN